jgi:hypothetical protein
VVRSIGVAGPSITGGHDQPLSIHRRANQTNCELGIFRVLDPRHVVAVSVE